MTYCSGLMGLDHRSPRFVRHVLAARWAGAVPKRGGTAPLPRLCRLHRWSSSGMGQICRGHELIVKEPVLVYLSPDHSEQIVLRYRFDQVVFDPLLH